MAIGVPYDTFWHLTPKKLNYFFSAYEEKRKIHDEEAWQLGLYIKSAIVSSFVKEATYFENPILKEEMKTELTEEQKIKETEKLFTQLKIMQSNFELNKKK